MKLAITGIKEAKENDPIVFRGNFQNMIQKAANIGYDGMELHIHDSSKLDREKLKRIFQENNITLTSIGTGSAYTRDHISLSCEEMAYRYAAIDRIREHIITASEYGAVVILGLINGLVRECINKDSFRNNFTSSLETILKYAEHYKVKLVIEVLNRYESDFLNTIDAGLKFISTFNTPYLMLHIDTYHMNIEEKSIPLAIKTAGSQIGHVHIADNDRWYAGHGHLEFKSIILSLKEANYNGTLAIESFQYPNEDESAIKSYKILRNLI